MRIPGFLPLLLAREFFYRKSWSSVSPVLISDFEDIQAHLRSFNSDIEIQNFIDEKRKVVQDLRHHLVQLQQWADDTRMKRLEAIIDRLKARGWSKEIGWLGKRDRYHPFFDVPAIAVSMPFGPQSWTQDIQDATITLLQKRREEVTTKRRKVLMRRRREENRETLSSLLTSLGELAPRMREFVSFPEIKRLLDAPYNVKLTCTDFAGIQPLLPKRVVQWRINAQKRVIDEFQKQTGIKGSADTITQLALYAIGPFCTRCDQVVPPLQLLEHDCFYDSVHSDNFYEKTLSSCSTSRRWSPGEFMDWRPSFMKPIVKLCGMDYSSATERQLDESEFRLCCKCLSHTNFRVIFTWRGAVQHKLQGCNDGVGQRTRFL
ncbi:hypothetical protein K474DRAFT_123718 [Panus rudis PR-1116 ss-1]|nr:hypothetical protein K474DRAFT_123718 [Panus rudis PR-1116 ss-1]